jgi:hypothetical protein
MNSSMFAEATLPPYRTGTCSPPSTNPIGRERLPDRAGHLRGIRAARVAARPDRPDRLVGDAQPGHRRRSRPRAGGAGSPAAAVDDLAAARLAIGQLLADAQDRAQAGLAPRPPCARSARPSRRVAAPLGVADDRPTSRAREHRRGDSPV